MKKTFMLLLSCLCALFSFSQTSDSTLKEFAGKYTFPTGSIIAEVSVVFENGSLSVNTVMGSSAMERKEGDVFIISQFQGTATFTRDANKKINGVTVDAMGYHLEGTKENGLAILLAKKRTYFFKNKLYWA